MHVATITITITMEMSDRELRQAQNHAADLDRENLDSDDPPESYSASLAMARIIASDSDVVAQLMPYCNEAGGYTAEPVK